MNGISPRTEIAASSILSQSRSGEARGDRGPFILKVTRIQTPTACHSEERSGKAI